MNEAAVVDAGESSPPPTPVDVDAVPPRRPPTREEMRANALAFLAPDREPTPLEQVTADLYAAVYSAELQLTMITRAFSKSKMARRVMGKQAHAELEADVSMMLNEEEVEHGERDGGGTGEASS